MFGILIAFYSANFHRILDFKKRGGFLFTPFLCVLFTSFYKSGIDIGRLALFPILDDVFSDPQ